MLLMEANWDKHDEALRAQGYEEGKVMGREEANDEAIPKLIYKLRNLKLSHAQILSVLTDTYKLSAEEAEERIKSVNKD